MPKRDNNCDYWNLFPIFYEYTTSVAKCIGVDKPRELYNMLFNNILYYYCIFV